MKKIMMTAFLLSMIILLAGCSGNAEGQEGASGGGSGKITVGGKDFTEQLILSKMTAIYLKEKGYDIEETSNMGSTVVRSALKNGQVDLYWEYTGTALVVFQKQPAESDPEITFEKVKEADAKDGLVWLEPAEVNNTYALMMRKDVSEELGLKTISDLADYIENEDGSLKFASNAEFYAREDGVKGLEKKYGFKFPAKNVTRMDSGLLYNALKDEQVDVSVGLSTDGRIKGFDLVTLEDDQKFFPAYNAAPVLREEIADEKISELLNQLSSKLSTEKMMELNYRVDVEHEDLSDVAREWLTEEGLID